jgi:hypothetical protein
MIHQIRNSVFRADYKEWGKKTFNIFDCIFLTSCKIRYEFFRGETKGLNMVDRAFEILKEIKQHVENTNSKDEEVKNEAYKELDFYVTLSVNIMSGKRIERDSVDSFISGQEKLDFSEDISLLEKELESHQYNEKLKQINIEEKRLSLESIESLDLIEEKAELSED